MGATEAITAAVLGLCEPGDEVLAFDPTYDSYAAAAMMTGARFVPVPLHPPDWTFDPDELAAAVTPRTRAILVNSPHNPTGRVFDRAELERIAAVVREHDLIAITDEVYEHLVFDGLEHVPLATLPDMAERTLTISSLGKTFSVTGWKVGWATGPAPLVAGGPRRQAVPDLRRRDAVPARGRRRAAPGRRLVRDVRAGSAGQARPHLRRARRRRLQRSPARRARTSSTPTSAPTPPSIARELPHRAGVVAIPTSVFSAEPARLRPTCASRSASGSASSTRRRAA